MSVADIIHSLIWRCVSGPLVMLVHSVHLGCCLHLLLMEISCSSLYLINALLCSPAVWF